MSLEEKHNEALFRRFVDEVMNQDKASARKELLSPDFVPSVWFPPSSPMNQDGVAMYRNSFSDLEATIDRLEAWNKRVTAVLTVRGTHVGDFLGVPATGRHVVFKTSEAMLIKRLKIVEHLTIPHQAELRWQLVERPTPSRDQASLMSKPYLDQDRPENEGIAAMWQTEIFTRVKFSAPALDELLAAFRTMNRFGGAEFAMFSFRSDPVIHWFVSRGIFNEINFFEHLFSSPALRSAQPYLKPRKSLSSLKWRWTDPYFLADEFAQALKAGGAYENFPGSDIEAKTLGEQVCDALFGDRYEDIHICTTGDPWGGWFRGIAWDWTWVGVDKARRKIWLLCLTDTD